MNPSFNPDKFIAASRIARPTFQLAAAWEKAALEQDFPRAYTKAVLRECFEAGNFAGFVRILRTYCHY